MKASATSGRSSKAQSIILAVLICISLGLTGLFVLKESSAASPEELNTKLQSNQALISDHNKSKKDSEVASAKLEVQLAGLKGALGAKPKFVESVTAARKSVESAKSKLPEESAGFEKQIAASLAVVSKAGDEATVTKQTKLLSDGIAALAKKVTAYDAAEKVRIDEAAKVAKEQEEQAAKDATEVSVAIPEAQNNNGQSAPGGSVAPVAPQQVPQPAPAPKPAGGAFEQYRAILNEVGGSSVPLVWKSGISAETSSDGTIYVGEGAASYNNPYWAMRHELAHVYQFRVGYYAIMESAAFNSAYGGNIEVLANCMAAFMGSSIGESCGGNRATVANAVLAGRVP